MKLKASAVLLSLSSFASFAFAEHLSAKEWPYPQDTPKVQKLSIGMASETPVDISRFLLARGVRSATINNAGSHVAYLSIVTGRNQLWTKNIKTGHTTQLTFGNGVSNYMWHPDGQRLLYSADNDGDEREAYYLMSLDGNKEELVLPHSSGYRVLGEFNLQGNKFSYASTERNGRDFDIYIYDLKRKKSKLVYESTFGFYPEAWRPSSNNMLIKEVRGEDGFDLFTLNIGSGKLKSLYEPDVSATFGDFAWKRDGSGFYMSSNHNSDMTQVQYHNMYTGEHSVIHSSQHSLENVQLCHNEKYLVWTENNNGFDRMYVQDLGSKRLRTLYLGEGVYSPSCTRGSDKMAVGVSAYNSPNTVYLVDLESGNSEPLIMPQLAGIDPDGLIKPEVVTFKARDGVEVQGLLYLPKGEMVDAPSVVFGIHGGPTAQSKPQWKPLVQYLVGKGIAYFDINVRGSTGFGKKYARLDNQKKRLDSVRDLIDGLAYLKKDGRVDVNRAAAIGGSYGGYMVNAVMGLYPGEFKAGASFVGVADWVRALQTASPGLKASDRIEYGDISDPKWQQFYRENSPINTVDKITVPMFYEHGVNDPRDPVTESDVMVEALRKRNIPVTYLRFPDEGHRVSKLENRVIFYRELVKYLERHL